MKKHKMSMKQKTTYYEINLKQAQLYVHKTKYIHFMNLNVLAEIPNLKESTEYQHCTFAT